jgi:hypothetical protein
LKIEAVKTRERIKRLRNFGSIQELQLLAKDELPGTKFDFERLRLIAELEKVKAVRKRDPKQDPRLFLFSFGARFMPEVYAKLYLQVFGEDMVQAIADGNSDLFREWAQAIDAWRDHRPLEDKLRSAVIKICVPQFQVFRRRWINAQLKSLGFNTEDDTAIYRQVTRILSELKIKTDGKTRRNPEDTKTRKTPR